MVQWKFNNSWNWEQILPRLENLWNFCLVSEVKGIGRFEVRLGKERVTLFV